MSGKERRQRPAGRERMAVGIFALAVVVAGVELVLDARLPGREHVVTVDSTAEVWARTAPRGQEAERGVVTRVAVVEFSENGDAPTVRSGVTAGSAAIVDARFFERLRVGASAPAAGPVFVLRGRNKASGHRRAWYPGLASGLGVHGFTAARRRRSSVSFLCGHPTRRLRPDRIVLACAVEEAGSENAWSLDDWRGALLVDAAEPVGLHREGELSFYASMELARRICTVAPVAQALGVEGYGTAAVDHRRRLAALKPPAGRLYEHGRLIAGLDAVARLCSGSGEPTQYVARALRMASEELDRRPWPLARVALTTTDAALADDIAFELSTFRWGGPLSLFREAALERGLIDEGESDHLASSLLAEWRARAGGPYATDYSSWRRALLALSVLTALVAAGRRRVGWGRLVAMAVAAVLACVSWDTGAAPHDSFAGGWRFAAMGVAGAGAWWMRRRAAGAAFVVAVLIDALSPADWSWRGVLPGTLTFVGVVALIPWRARAIKAAPTVPRRPTRWRLPMLVAAVCAVLVTQRYFPLGDALSWESQPWWLPTYGSRLLDFPPFVESTTTPAGGALTVPARLAPELQPWHAVGMVAVGALAVLCASCARRGAAFGPLARVLLVWLVALHAAALFLASVPAEWHHRLEEFAVGGAVGSAVLTGLAAAAAARFRSTSVGGAA